METLNLCTLNFWYDLSRGPLVWISFVVLILGCIYRTITFLSITRKKDNTYLTTAQKKKISKQSEGKGFFQILGPLKFTVLGLHPVVIIVSTIFHLILFITPIFLLAHNMLLDESIGVSLVSFSEKITDYMTIIFLAGALFFLIRRILIPRVRAITSFYDYSILFITVAPFLTGFLAYYQIFDYKLIVTLHMLSGELMLVAAPFTKIFHMVFFFFGRFIFANEHTLLKGSRTW